MTWIDIHFHKSLSLSPVAFDKERKKKTFFSNTCGLSNFDIATMFKNAGKDKEADCFRNLIEWLNEGSHSADMNDFKDAPSDAVIQMYMNFFEETFRITGNHGQYNLLMQ